MKLVKLFLAMTCLAGCAAPAFAQTAPGPWSLSVAYDTHLNKPVALANFAVLSAHSPLILPAFSLSTVAFGGSVLGGSNSALTGGIGEQISYLYKGITFSAFFGQAFTIGAHPDGIIGAGVVIPIGG